jgi:hypothetical protein
LFCIIERLLAEEVSVTTIGVTTIGVTTIGVTTEGLPTIAVPCSVSVGEGSRVEGRGGSEGLHNGGSGITESGGIAKGSNGWAVNGVGWVFLRGGKKRKRKMRNFDFDLFISCLYILLGSS